jgi:hypothetical protein
MRRSVSHRSGSLVSVMARRFHLLACLLKPYVVSLSLLKHKMQPSSANSGAAPLSTDLRAHQHAVHTVVDTANEQTDAVPGAVSDRSPINLWTQAIHSSWRGNGRRLLMPSPVYHGRTVLASTVFTDDVRFVGLAADGVRR